MLYLSSDKLEYIGCGANGKVYRVLKEESGYTLSAVVKSGICNPEKVRENYNALKHCAVLCLAFMEECRLDDKPAILMEDLSTDDVVYVSPNSVRNGYRDNAPESYLLNHKISDIANFDNIIEQLQDLVYCTGCKGVELSMDTIFFGVNRGESAPRLSYKIVDIDGMIVDPTCDKSHLKDYNAKEIKFALQLFIEYFVETGERKTAMLNKLKDIEL